MIIKEKNKKIVLFNDVNLGDVFCYDGECYIKTETTSDEDGCINCVDLDNGSFFYIE